MIQQITQQCGRCVHGIRRHERIEETRPDPSGEWITQTQRDPFNLNSSPCAEEYICTQLDERRTLIYESNTRGEDSILSQRDESPFGLILERGSRVVTLPDLLEDKASLRREGPWHKRRTWERGRVLRLRRLHAAPLR